MDFWKGYIFLFVAAFCFATSGVVGDSIIRLGLSPLTLASWRVLLACLFVFLFLLVTRPRLLKIMLKDMPLFLVLGFVGISAFQAFFFTTIDLTSVAVAVTLMHTSPVFIVIISYFTFREPITRRKALAIALTLAGCFLVTGGYETGSSFLAWREAGLWTGLATGLSYAVYIIVGKFVLARYKQITVLFYSFFFGAIPLIFLGLPWRSAGLLLTADISWRLLYLALVPMLLAYGLYLKGLSYVEAGHAAIFGAFEPVIATFLAYLLLDQLLTLAQMIGFFLVLLALVILLLPERKKLESKAEKEVEKKVEDCAAL